MLTNFQISGKTRIPFCGLECCGNKFGRIKRSKYAKTHSGINRIKRSRRYCKRVEKQLIQKEIHQQLMEEILDIDDFNREMAHFED